MTEQPQTNEKPYRNHKIILKDNWEFAVEGPEFDDSKYKIRFASYQAAREEIDKRVKDTEMLAAKNVKLDVKVSNAHGNIVLVTRINRQSGDLAGVTTKYVYPPVLWIRESLFRLDKLTSEAEQIRRSLKEFEISSSRGYGRIDADEYARIVMNFQRELDEATKKAKERERPIEVGQSTESAA